MHACLHVSAAIDMNEDEDKVFFPDLDGEDERTAGDEVLQFDGCGASLLDLPA
jgi:hypothetical protein